MASEFLDEKLHNIYLIDLTIGVISSIVDNVPLVASAMGMYPVHTYGYINVMADPVSTGICKVFCSGWTFLGVSGLLCRYILPDVRTLVNNQSADHSWQLINMNWLYL